MVSHISNNLRQAALATSLLSGGCLHSQELPGHHRPQHAATLGAISPRDRESLAPYIAPLPYQELSPHFARHLISHHGMSATTSGVALDAYHLIFVSWDERGTCLIGAFFSLRDQVIRRLSRFEPPWKHHRIQPKK